MASGANTWFKKLRAIDKRNGVALSRGTFKQHSLASTLSAPPKPIVKVKPRDVAPRADYKPGKLKGGSGCKLNQATRDLLAARRELRGALLG